VTHYHRLAVRLAFTCLAAAALISAQPASAQTSCSYTLIQDYSVETCTDFGGCVTMRTKEFAWVCTSGGGGTGTGGTGSTGGSTGPVIPPPPPSLQLISMDDADPSHLELVVSGSSNITATEILLNGRSVALYPGSPGFGRVLDGPGVAAFPVNRTSTLALRGCTSDLRCVETSFDLYRGYSGVGAYGPVSASIIDMSQGVPVLKAYPYSFSLAENVTQVSYYGVQPLSNAARIQFRNAKATLMYWSIYQVPQPAYLSTHWVTNLGPEIFADSGVYQQGMYGCSPGSWLGDGDRAVANCALTSGFGGAPKAGVSIDSMSLLTSKGATPAFYTGGELEVSP